MRQDSEKFKSYIYDGHGHSTASDGMHSPEKIIDMAIIRGLNIIGLSDHNLISNLPAFLEYADKINKHEQKILAIPSVEISTTKGDLLVAIPDRNKADDFLRYYKKPSKRFHPLEIIEEYITRFNAITVFLHPNVSYVNGFKVSEIEKTLEQLPQRLHKNIGIEVYNWMTQAFFWNRQKIEQALHKKNFTLGLAPFSFTDYHSAYHVGNGSTQMQMSELTSQQFIEAVQNRRTAPLAISKRSATEYLSIVKATLIAESLSRFGHRNFRVPKNET